MCSERPTNHPIHRALPTHPSIFSVPTPVVSFIAQVSLICGKNLMPSVRTKAPSVCVHHGVPSMHLLDEGMSSLCVRGHTLLYTDSVAHPVTYSHIHTLPHTTVLFNYLRGLRITSLPVTSKSLCHLGATGARNPSCGVEFPAVLTHELLLGKVRHSLDSYIGIQ